MHLTTSAPLKSEYKFPPFDLERLLRTSFRPLAGERLCILIDLEDLEDVIDFSFLNNPMLPIQQKAYTFFYLPLKKALSEKLQLKSCDFFAYEITGGSNLELPRQVMAPTGKKLDLERDIYPNYDIILCISTYSATAPLTAAAKRFGFRGGTLHGLNDIILQSGLAVDYNEVSNFTEKLRQGMTKADSVDIEFEVDGKNYALHIDLARQEAAKSHGICHTGPDIANLPAGEVYFVPANAQGQFPIKFDDGTIGLMDVKDCYAYQVTLLQGKQSTIDACQDKLSSDPATGVLGELGFGTQQLPFADSDIQDEKIFGTFHIATGRNDHLNGTVTKDKFLHARNATHDDILFSSTKTPEIVVKQVRMLRNGKNEVLIEYYEPCAYLLNLLKS